MNAVVSTKPGLTMRRQGVWLVVAAVTLLHMSGVVVVKYGLPDWSPKRLSEITIELGGTILRGDGGEGVRRASLAPRPTSSMPQSQPVPAQSGGQQAAPTPAVNDRTSSAGAVSSTESSTSAGVQAAPTVDADYKAAYLNNPKPPYPLMALQMRNEGTVMLKALVQPDGSCGEVLLARSSGHELLDQSALKTVAQWRFVPARSQGKEVSQWVSIPIVFNLKRR